VSQELNSWGAIWRLTWPLVLTMAASALVGLFDAWIAGGIGPVAQAAVGLTLQMVLLINATVTAVSIGAQALVARFVGARSWDEAARATMRDYNLLDLSI
jgi:Na+-driven multidrug efflux pump